MKNNKIVYLAQGALIAAMYVALTFAANMLSLASGAVQVRFSEALTVLPFFTPTAIPGLFIGCLLANILTGCALWDVVFGSLATLTGAVFTYLLRKWKWRNMGIWLASAPPILANTLIVPFILRYVYGLPDALPYLMMTVGAGEVISCGALGMALLLALRKYESQIFGRGK